MALSMLRRLTRTCQCKLTLHAHRPRSHPYLSSNPSSDPPKFLQNPLGYLKCLLIPFTSREVKALASSQIFFKNGMGYFAEQSTKPQTIGYSLADSPVGLLAWVYEKLVSWTDAFPWTDDEGMALHLPSSSTGAS